ncbi:hypothetical protein V6N11_025712 [Hibiscus sabdariffa]|uniref:Uncharacterized protein n=1 Tax=Hibiscus sabdariffa TaxID=183260 RepID=A0ABR2STF4_9ROSI
MESVCAGSVLTCTGYSSSTLFLAARTYPFPFLPTTPFDYVVLHQSEYEYNGGEEIRGVESETCGRVRECDFLYGHSREALKDFGNKADARAKKSKIRTLESEQALRNESRSYYRLQALISDFFVLSSTSPRNPTPPLYHDHKGNTRRQVYDSSPRGSKTTNNNVKDFIFFNSR